MLSVQPKQTSAGIMRFAGFGGSAHGCSMKCIDLLLRIAGQAVVFQQDAVLQGLVTPFNLSLRPGVTGRTAEGIHLPVFQPASQLAREVTGPVVAGQSQLVQDLGPIATRGFQRQVECFGRIARPHCDARLPGGDAATVIVQDHGQVTPSL